ncbi:site-specific integrase [Halobacteroides halobius]|uniref:site-specific integrase n=1 Tax=Halobacteroides halobius TaxID=42422 RepID=UPI0002FB77B3|nr:site-specific integrase [Halobacteroides halobius]
MSDNFTIEEVERQLKLKGYSPKTIAVYLSHVKSFIRFFDNNLDRITNKKVNKYLLYLLEERGLSHSFVNQAINAIKFVINEILNKDNISVYILFIQLD